MSAEEEAMERALSADYVLTPGTKDAVEVRLAEIRERTQAIFTGAIITDPAKAKRAFAREVARLLNCGEDEVGVEINEDGSVATITVPPIVSVQFTVLLAGRLDP